MFVGLDSPHEYYSLVRYLVRYIYHKPEFFFSLFVQDDSHDSLETQSRRAKVQEGKGVYLSNKRSEKTGMCFFFFQEFIDISI
jgi:hypothetical protein